MGDNTQQMPDWMEGAAEECAPNPEKMDLKSIMLLATQAVEIQKKLEDLETLKDRLEGELTKLTRNVIPEAMKSLGIDDFKLSTGHQVLKRSSVQASITEATKTAAFQWLRDNGYEGLIKTAVSLSFGRDEDEEAQRITGLLTDEGLSPELKSSVHPATLKAFVKERLEKGDEIPSGPFNIYEFEEAVIAFPKTPKAPKKAR